MVTVTGVDTTLGHLKAMASNLRVMASKLAMVTDTGVDWTRLL